MGADEYRSVPMDAVGCEGTGGTQKQGKKSNKWVSKVYFATHAHNTKNQEVRRDGHGGQRGS